MKIALCGPPHSGKSVLRQRLKRALTTRNQELYPYFLNANPDGEGSWFQEAYSQDPGTAAEMKKTAKQKWTAEHAEQYANWVRNTTLPLTLIDLGGIIDDYNRRICALATHAILLAPDEAALAPWRAFCDECGLAILAELISDYPGTEDQVEAEAAGAPFRARVHRLERGELETPRPAVDALAEVILRHLGH